MTKKRKRRRKTMTIPIAPIAGLGAGVAPAIPHFMAGNWETGLYEICNNFTGYYPPDGNFDFRRLGRGLLPLIIGCLIHKYVGGPPLNVNRALGAAGVPLIRI